MRIRRHVPTWEVFTFPAAEPHLAVGLLAHCSPDIDGLPEFCFPRRSYRGTSVPRVLG